MVVCFFCDSLICIKIRAFCFYLPSDCSCLCFPYLILFLFCVVALTLFATDVLGPGSNPAAQIVGARKLAMRAIGANVGDLKGKVAKGESKAVAANANAIASLATFLPTVYDKEYSEVYPVAGSPYYFKGATVEEVRKLSGNLNREAETLAALAMKEDKAGVEAQMNKLLGSCGACHKAARGKY